MKSVKRLQLSIYILYSCLFCTNKKYSFSTVFKNNKKHTVLPSNFLTKKISCSKILHLHAVKCNLTNLTTKRSWYLSSGQRFAVGRAGSVPPSVVACFSMAYQSGLQLSLELSCRFLLLSWSVFLPTSRFVVKFLVFRP